MERVLKLLLPKELSTKILFVLDVDKILFRESDINVSGVINSIYVRPVKRKSLMNIIS